MQITFAPFTVHKRFALTISRGTTAQNTNLWIKITHEGIEGWGEATPFSIAEENRHKTTDFIPELQNIIPNLSAFHPLDRQEIANYCQKNRISSALRAGIDTALWDWLGKKARLPLWQLYGLNRDRIVPISVTIGISSPDAARERVKNWLKVINAEVLKVKLGNPDGIEADQAMLTAIRQEAPHLTLTVDANGGWNLADAITMAHWLKKQGVKYLEQPLNVADDEKLPELAQNSPLPIFVDESCFTRADIPRLAGSIDGINIKLMKAGGLSEVIAMIHTAKAYNLQIMFGCYSDSTLANTAMFHLAPWADYLDLDSHLNLVDDPFTGLVLEQGRLLPNDSFGLGVNYRASES